MHLTVEINFSWLNQQLEKTGSVKVPLYHVPFQTNLHNKEISLLTDLLKGKKPTKITL